MGNYNELYKQAEEYEKQQEYAKAINCLNKIPESFSEYKKVAAKKEQLQLILKFNNTDIYGNTNLFMDPWE